MRMLLAVLFLATACTDLEKDTSDMTLPSVVFEVRGADGAFHRATDATLRAGQALDLRCTVSDGGGVSRGSLVFAPRADGCDVVGLPGPVFQAIAGDAGSSVLDRLPLAATLGSGLACTGAGAPHVEVTCTGENWSENPATRKASRVLDVALL